MTIGILNSNTGNMENIIKSVRYLGFKPIIIEERNQLLKISHLIIPGVGSFPKIMDYLKKNKMDEILKDYLKIDLKIMGICLGMHIMFENSEEFENRKGLHLIKGNIKKINLSNFNVTKRYVPNIGYHKIKKKKITNSKSLFDKFNLENFYFSHSFKVWNYPNNDERYEISYFKEQILALIIKNKNLIGCQFHPELSGEKGLDFIDTFIKWSD